MFIKDIRKDFYDSLKDNRVLILVHYDVDAICALRIFQFLLQSDNIQYSVLPIGSIKELVKAYKDNKNSVKRVVLLNFGGLFDVVDELNPVDGTRIFIADSHRPLDVYNIYRGEEVQLLVKENKVEDIPASEDLFRESDGESDDEDDEQRFSLAKLEKRKRRREWEEKRINLLFEYEKYHSYGESVALTFFKLAWRMSKDNNELLWLAIVAVTDQFINCKIEKDSYEIQCHQLNSHVTRLSHLRNDSMLTDTSTSDPADSTITDPLRVATSLSIELVKDIQIKLYHHWSLYESLRHSSHVACKFKVWELKGQKRLLEFLAELGVPLVQCRQKFTSMDLELRKNVLNWIEDLSEKYNLDQIIGNSFVAIKGYKRKYRAEDIAHSVRALLECASHEKRNNQRFFDALDCLSWNNNSILDEGIELAKLQLTAILKLVQDIVAMKNIKSAGPFLHVVIQESAPDSKLLCYPGCLNFFSKFLLEAYIASSKNSRVINFPLVVMASDLNMPGTIMVVGIPPLIENSPRNFFGQAFKQAVRLIKCRIEPDLYDPSVVRLPSEEKNNLIEALVSLLS